MNDFNVERTAYNNMLHRCYNEDHGQYHDYGGRGITVSLEWRLGFENFLNDMGERPSDDHSIDRIDNTLGYSKENCKWSTRSEQNYNRRKKKDTSVSTGKITFDGLTQSRSKWCRDYDISTSTVHWRMRVKGLTFEEAVKGKSWPKEPVIKTKMNFIKNIMKEAEEEYKKILEEKWNEINAK